MNEETNDHYEEEQEQSVQAGIVGTLETWPLGDIVYWLNLYQRTAMVRIGVGLEAGVLFFKKGELFRAEWGSLKGEHAFYELIRQVDFGSFAVIFRKPPQALTNIPSSTAQLLYQINMVKNENNPQAMSA
ncbi:DUF4388 domain-containing protein [Myxococcota bacterium]|nr:DUF4388 domain-containing protein [Myxococcota bacterium]